MINLKEFLKHGFGDGIGYGYGYGYGYGHHLDDVLLCGSGYGFGHIYGLGYGFGAEDGSGYGSDCVGVCATNNLANSDVIIIEE